MRVGVGVGVVEGERVLVAEDFLCFRKMGMALS